MIRVFVPADTAAVAVGADEVAADIAAEASARGEAVAVVRTGSRGLFWLEPLVEVEAEGGRVAYGPVTAKDVPSLFDAGLLTGGDHPLALGRIDAHPWLSGQTRLTFARCGVIDPQSCEEYAQSGGLEGLRRALSIGADATIEEIATSGLRGRGGAGFPAGVKWRTVREAVGAPKYVVCNADEGDSGTFADRMLMEGDPLSLIEGMALAGFAVGASKGYVYGRSEYPRANAAFERALAAARGGRLLGS